MKQRMMHSYPIEDGTIELLVHKRGKTYGLKVCVADFSSQKALLSQLHKMCRLATETK